MIRVGFRLIGGVAWQGGRNYLWNLLHAVSVLPARTIQPVLLLGPGDAAGDLPAETFVTDARFDSANTRRAGRLLKLASGRNLVELAWLRRARIDVVSHAQPVGRVPTIAWVPDVQHRRLPHMFSQRERIMRDLMFREIVRDAAIVVTSSETARADLQRFYGASDARCRVLRFVSQPRGVATVATTALAVPPRFFHLPNQLWKHKNHLLVVEALAQVPEAIVVATGPREDYRHAGMYDQLMARVRELGLGDRFLHLGLVEFADLVALMRRSVAVINPSRFEGWSTTVEEAKSLGKRVLVSDIPVHHEQDPPRARYFDVDDPTALAALMREAWATHDPEADARAAAAAAAALPERTRAFGETYQAIVREVAR
ncbi:MAG: glycosyltransferase family 1 protein [Kofleriaceae bacterium]